MLSDGRYSIRPYRAEDVAAVHEAGLESSARVGPWFARAHNHLSAEEVANFITTRTELWAAGVERSFAIVDAASGRYLGGVWLNQLDLADKRANLGFWVRTSALRAGVATAAARLGAQFAFEQLALDHVDVVVAIGNAASQRVAERLGARPLGIMPGRLELRGARVDALVFELDRPVSAPAATPRTP